MARPAAPTASSARLAVLAAHFAAAAVLGGCSGDGDSRHGTGGADATGGGGAQSSSTGGGSSSSAGGGGGHDVGTPAPGTTTEVGSCDPGSLPMTTCTLLSVSCPGTSDIGVSVRVTTPAGPPLGTVVLQSGGDGTYFFEDFPNESAWAQELAAARFVLVQRAWDPPGWFVGDSGMHALSCRFATLLRWIEKQHGAAAPLCAVGTSGGAIEIGYALSRWDGADRLAGAVLLSGPSISQLDLVCPSVAPSKWLDHDCPALAAKDGVTPCSPLVCTAQVDGAAAVVDGAWAPNHPCTDAADADLATLEVDGVVSPDMRRDYPATMVGFALGGDECATTPLLYYEAIDSKRRLTIVPGAPHGVLGTAEGDSAARDLFKAVCAPY